jgi:tetratricopeptide (TPR) repeat protein
MKYFFTILISILLSSCFLHKKTADDYMVSAKKYSDKKDYARAIKNYSKAIDLNRSYFIAYWERSLVEIKMDSLELAIDDMGVYIEDMRAKESVADKKLLEKALMQRAAIMLKKGYKSDACSDFSDACQLNISNYSCEQYRLHCK